ncbi:MAG: cysteine desulfurase [Planctomycetes bacterium]|nr:cysteine desulfurase [Planctomycetota bacterium]
MKIYLDNHATTQVDPVVLEAMRPFYTDDFGNAASRTHFYGWSAADAVKKARSKLADSINARGPDEIIFLSGATEANNLAIIGTCRYQRKKSGKNELIVSNIEHSSVLDVAEYLESDGFIIKTLNVDRDGLVRASDLKEMVGDKTVLVSCMLVNNEIGVIQDVETIGKICRDQGVIFHSDCAQAFGKTRIDVQKMHIDLLTATAHKIYGPKGIGILYQRQFKPRCKLEPLIYGGGHEGGMRSGTLNVPAIVGFAKAAEIAIKCIDKDERNVGALRDKLLLGIKKNLDYVYLNGSQTSRIYNNLNIAFEYIEGEALLTFLNERGIAVTSGSACSSLKKEPSHVLKALGVRDDLIHSSVRFGLGRFNNNSEIEYAIKVIVEAVMKLRKLSPLYEESESKRGIH